MKLHRMAAWLLALTLVLLTILPALAETEHIWRLGDTGEQVERIQARLVELDYLTSAVTGIFDETTETALIRFQSRNGLLITGMADERTLECLFSEEAKDERAESEGWFLAEEAALGGGVYDAAVLAAPLATRMPITGATMKWNTNEYTFFQENGFQSATQAPLSTFAADVDTASYAQLRAMILRGETVPADAVRVEEMLNYFHYDYPQPTGNHPFGVSLELAPCLWNPGNLLLQVGLQAKAIPQGERPAQNLVFLIDVSGSMFGSDRLDLVKRAFQLLLEELEPTDMVSLVTYASRDEIILEGVPAADKVRIMEAISGLEAGGSTNSASGIQTAYALAEKYAREDSANRVLMATDGDFNVGLTTEGELARLVMKKKEAGVRLTMLGVGYGNYKDNKLEALADYGDGNYYYLDSIFEARRALVMEAGGTLTEVAKDVKLQLDFNPEKVSAYRLIGYEDRVMDAQDFANDTKDGGEIGSGHRVTALYEIVPAGSDFDPGIPASRYVTPVQGETENPEWLTLAIRYKAPGAEESTLEEYPLRMEPAEQLSENMKWAAAVAECAMILRDSEYRGEAALDSTLELARSCGTVLGDPYKEEFVYLLTLLQRGKE
ncbi:MAG: von Willebrand factor type A domain-containing protein [Clostridia bacterium]|nr:von Willebrand factor type A domain-containing protein [Clostridia bacterium]MBQ9252168.1 von Willebrand factor type A domain-containing protein [Clostridia bacterium]